VRESIRELQADRAAGLYRGSEELETWRATLMQYRAFEDACVAKLAELAETAQEAVSLPSEWHVEPGTDPIGAGSLWASWSVYERRELLALFMRGISVSKGRTADGRIVPVAERVEVIWLDVA
jgi:hypothetical protein